MKTDAEREKEVDEYILKYSGLVKEKRGYNALLQLLHSGILMNERLGEDDTVELCKILNHLKFDYEFISFGIKLKDNTKLHYYHRVMHPPKPISNEQTNNNQSKRDRRLGVGKEETGTRHWGENITSRKNDPD
jgi:hypothetical protein